MGREQHHAGLHVQPRQYKYKTDTLSSLNKYACIVAETNLQFANYKEPGFASVMKKKEELLKNAMKHNSIVLLEAKSEKISCQCGGNRIHYREDNAIKIQTKRENVIIVVPGKKCMNCGKMYVIKSVLFQEAKKNGLL